MIFAYALQIYKTTSILQYRQIALLQTPEYLPIWLQQLIPQGLNPDLAE